MTAAAWVTLGLGIAGIAITALVNYTMIVRHVTRTETQLKAALDLQAAQFGGRMNVQDTHIGHIREEVKRIADAIERGKVVVMSGPERGGGGHG